MKARTQAGYDALLKSPMVDPAKVALIGYCFGGLVGVEFGSTGVPLVANVSIHGSFRDHAPGWAKNAKGMFLILHGAEDEGYPLSAVDKEIQELRAAKVPFQYEVYSGTGARLLRPEEQGRGARQREVDRLDRANAQGTFRRVRGRRGFRKKTFFTILEGSKHSSHSNRLTAARTIARDQISTQALSLVRS